MVVKSKRNSYLDGLGANERAIIQKLPFQFLQKILAHLVRIKMKLQFTGWLQFLIPLVFLAPLSLVGVLLLVLGLPVPSLIPFSLASVLVLTVLTDLITVKGRFHFSEKTPLAPKDQSPENIMKLRHSCRSFQGRLLTKGHLKSIKGSIEKNLSGLSTPASTSVKMEYLKSPLTVWPVVGAKEFLVALTPKKYNRRDVIAVGQILQNIVLDATGLGVGTCWIGPGAKHDDIWKSLPEQYSPEQWQIICVCALGYPSRHIPLFLRFFNHQMKKRLPLDQLFYSDSQLQKPYEHELLKDSHLKAALVACQGSPSSYNGQTTRAWIQCTANGKIQSLDFAVLTESRYYAPVALGIWCANWQRICEHWKISGHFVELLDSKSRGKDANLSIPHYDMRWVMD